jgi:hypothetical protein
MKLAIIFAVLCVIGCGSAPTDYGTTSEPSSGGGGYEPVGNADNSLHCGEWHYVTVWENGQPTPQLQPILCADGPNVNPGDPAPDVGDPNPWENHVFVESDKHVNVSAPQTNNGNSH